MDFRILGPFEVLDDGRRVALGGAKQRALLALLVIHANEPLGTERLIDELWGEHPPATAGTHSTRVAAWRAKVPPATTETPRSRSTSVPPAI